MGCSSGKVRVVKPTTMTPVPIKNEEIEEVANLPIRAKAEDIDLVSMVELTVRCTDLLVQEGSTATDTLVVFSLQEEDVWLEKGRSEVCRATSSPKFITAFAVQYCFEKKQRFKMDVYDFSSMPESNSLVKHGIIGSAIFNIHEVVCSPTQSITRALVKGSDHRDRGSITVTSEEMSRLNHTVRLTFKLGSVSRTAPLFFRLSRALETDTSSYIPFYESEQIVGPEWVWKSFETTVNAFCRGNETRKVLFELYRARKKEPQLLGSFELTLADLKFSETRFEGMLRMNERVVNRILLQEFVYEEKASFLDFIFGGCEISLVIGIDFTRSNGTPDLRDSLHHLSGHDSENEYIQAIRGVGDILQYYDSDKRIPVFGFGAKLPPYFDIVSHCFALNGNIFDPEVKGIEKVVEEYRRACKEVVFHGPTVFSHLIRRVAAISSAREVSQDHQQYFLLLIITDGNLNDMEATSNELVKASALPLSVIIVGVGDEDFAKMRELDADESPLFSKQLNKYMERDIVQFVPFSRFKGNVERLAREVLFEVPNQLLSYMEGRGIKPGAPKNSTQTLESLHQVTLTAPMLSSNRLHLSFPSPINMMNTPVLMQHAKKRFVEDAVALGFDLDSVQEVVDRGIPCADINILVELINYLRAQAEFSKGREYEQMLSESLSVNDDNQNADALLCKVCLTRPVDTRCAAACTSLPRHRTAAFLAKRCGRRQARTLAARTRPSSPQQAEARTLPGTEQRRSSLQPSSAIVLLECGHRVVCAVCVKDLSGKCPACGNKIIRSVKSR